MVVFWLIAYGWNLLYSLLRCYLTFCLYVFSGIVLVCLLLAVLEEVGVIPPASKEENDMNLFLRQIYHGPTKEVIDGFIGDGFVGGQGVRLSCRAEYNAYRHGLSSAKLSLLSEVEYVDEQRQCLPAERGDSHIVCYTHEANECYFLHNTIPTDIAANLCALTFSIYVAEFRSPLPKDSLPSFGFKYLSLRVLTLYIPGGRGCTKPHDSSLGKYVLGLIQNTSDTLEELNIHATSTLLKPISFLHMLDALGPSLKKLTLKCPIWGPRFFGRYDCTQLFEDVLMYKYPDLARNSDVHLSFESRAVQRYCRVTATSWDQVLLSVG